MTTLFDLTARQATKAGEIDSFESIPGLLKRFQRRAQGDVNTLLRGRIQKLYWVRELTETAIPLK